MNRMDPRKQFSKWLAKSDSIYWFAAFTALIAVIAFVPDAAIACVYMAIILSVDKIINVWAYTRNSIYEKGFLAMLEKTRMELTLKPVLGKKSEKEDHNDEEITEGESNG